jgi:hypothetical protein
MHPKDKSLRVALRPQGGLAFNQSRSDTPGSPEGWEVARSFGVIGTWLVSFCRRASWAMGGAGVLGGVAYEACTRLHFAQTTTWLCSLGLASIGACMGRIADNRCRNDRPGR